MKRLNVFLTLTLFLCSFVCYRIYSQGNFAVSKTESFGSDSSIRLDGYYVRRFEKKKIADMEKNRQNRMRGKSFRIPIDTELCEDFFFPARKDSVNLEKMIYGLPGKNINAIYLYCTNANYSIFNAQFRDGSGKMNIDTCFKFRSIEYYVLNKTDKYCYQVFYLSGNWLSGLAITQVQKQLFPQKIKYVDDTSLPINVFLLNKILGLNEVQDSPLKLWKKVPEIFDN